jgi:hypothetical protein
VNAYKESKARVRPNLDVRGTAAMPYRRKRKKLRKKDIKFYLWMTLIALIVSAVIAFIHGEVPSIMESMEDSAIEEIKHQVSKKKVDDATLKKLIKKDE